MKRQATGLSSEKLSPIAFHTETNNPSTIVHSIPHTDRQLGLLQIAICVILSMSVVARKRTTLDLVVATNSKWNTGRIATANNHDIFGPLHIEMVSFICAASTIFVSHIVLDLGYHLYSCCACWLACLPARLLAMLCSLVFCFAAFCRASLCLICCTLLHVAMLRCPLLCCTLIACVSCLASDQCAISNIPHIDVCVTRSGAKQMN